MNVAGTRAIMNIHSYLYYFNCVKVAGYNDLGLPNWKQENLIKLLSIVILYGNLFYTPKCHCLTVYKKFQMNCKRMKQWFSGVKYVPIQQFNVQ